MWGVRCCIWYVVVSVRIGEVFNSSVDWCKRLWDVRCCSQYVVVSESIGEVFNVAVSSGASNGGAFVVVFGIWR